MTSASQDDLRAALRDDVVAVAAATARFHRTLGSLSDDALRAPSLLPGWSRAHVAGHVARNAEGMLNLVAWAVTGVRTPMYPSAQAREEGIASAAALDAAALRALSEDAAARFDAALDNLLAAPDAALERLVLFGPDRPDVVPDVPASSLVYARLREVEIHHVDLGAAYSPDLWPGEFVSRTHAWIDGRVGPTDVTGDPAEVLAWRIGRGAGPSVAGPDGGAPPAPPAW